MTHCKTHPFRIAILGSFTALLASVAPSALAQAPAPGQAAPRPPITQPSGAPSTTPTVPAPGEPVAPNTPPPPGALAPAATAPEVPSPAPPESPMAPPSGIAPAAPVMAAPEAAPPPTPEPGAEGFGPNDPLAGYTSDLAYLRSADNEFQFFPSGRLQVDGLFYKRDSDKMPTPSFILRRARLEAQGWVGPWFFYYIAGDFALTAGNPLGDALMRPGRVVVDLVLDQDGAQMRLTEDQHAVEELAAQGTEEAFAGRVHPGSLDSGPQDPGPVGLEDGVEGLGEV